MNEPAIRPSSTTKRVLVFFIGFIAFDLCAGFLSTDIDFALLLFIPALAAQLAVAAAWAVFAPRPLIERTLTSALAAMCWHGAAALPMGLNLPGNEFAESYWLLYVPPFLAMQVPLWTCRLAYGWHIVEAAEPGSDAPMKWQFGIRDLLTGVSTAAIWLGLLKLSLLPLSGQSGARDEDALELMIAMVVAGLWLGLLIIPFVYAALGPAEGSISTVALLLAVNIVASPVLIAVGGFLILVAHIIILAVFLWIMLAARRHGFVLRWVPRRTRVSRP